jgi:hypothetical protein
LELSRILSSWTFDLIDIIIEYVYDAVEVRAVDIDLWCQDTCPVEETSYLIKDYQRKSKFAAPCAFDNGILTHHLISRFFESTMDKIGIVKDFAIDPLCFSVSSMSVQDFFSVEKNQITRTHGFLMECIEEKERRVAGVITNIFDRVFSDLWDRLTSLGQSETCQSFAFIAISSQYCARIPCRSLFRLAIFVGLMNGTRVRRNAIIHKGWTPDQAEGCAYPALARRSAFCISSATCSDCLIQNNKMPFVSALLGGRKLCLQHPKWQEKWNQVVSPFQNEKSEAQWAKKICAEFFSSVPLFAEYFRDLPLRDFRVLRKKTRLAFSEAYQRLDDLGLSSVTTTTILPVSHHVE